MRSCVCRRVDLRRVFTNCHFSAIERSLAPHAALVDILKSASSSLVKATITAQSSSPMRSESFVERIRNSKSNSVTLAQSAPPTMTTTSSLPINPVQRRHRAQLQQDNGAFGRQNELTTSTLGLQGLLTLYLTLVTFFTTHGQQRTNDMV
jgi:hypothetical protein